MLRVGQADSPTVRVFSKTNNSVTLSIFRPGYRGDLPITKYSVVYRNVTVSVHPSNDSVLVPIKDLTSNTIYKFEVSVHNGYGASEIATVTVKTDGEFVNFYVLNEKRDIHARFVCFYL